MQCNTPTRDTICWYDYLVLLHRLNRNSLRYRCGRSASTGYKHLRSGRYPGRHYRLLSPITSSFRASGFPQLDRYQHRTPTRPILSATRIADHPCSTLIHYLTKMLSHGPSAFFPSASSYPPGIRGFTLVPCSYRSIYAFLRLRQCA